MKYSVYYNERSYKRTINKMSTFLMIGNNIDGSVNFDIREFENFKDLSDELLDILANLNCCGEWDINIYQVKKPYRI